MWCNTMGYYAAVKKNEGNHILTNVKRPPNQTINKQTAEHEHFDAIYKEKKTMKVYPGLSKMRGMFWICTVHTIVASHP